MTTTRALPFTLLVALAVFPTPIDAHHGAAAYDTGRLTMLTATVTAFDWRNPHALLHFDVEGQDGQTTGWTAETAGLVILIRAGWHRDVLKAGDRITVFGIRAVNGTHTMLIQRIVRANGQELTSVIPPK